MSSASCEIGVVAIEETCIKVMKIRGVPVGFQDGPMNRLENVGWDWMGGAAKDEQDELLEGVCVGERNEDIWLLSALHVANSGTIQRSNGGEAF